MDRSQFQAKLDGQLKEPWEMSAHIDLCRRSYADHSEHEAELRLTLDNRFLIAERLTMQRYGFRRRKGEDFEGWRLQDVGHDVVEAHRALVGIYRAGRKWRAAGPTAVPRSRCL